MVTVMACARCEDLEEQLAAAKRALGEVDAANDLSALRRWLELPRGQARLVLRLYRAKGRVMPTWLLQEELINPDANLDGVKTQVCNIRRRLGEGFVETDGKLGYRLPASSYVRVRDALAAGV